MLVLTRKKCQHILFPNLGIKVEVLRIAGNSVSLGIKAPESIQVLRGELQETRQATSAGEHRPAEKSSLHQLRNQLHQAQLVVALAQKQLQLGSPQDAEATLEKMLYRLKELEKGIANSDSAPNSQTLSSASPRSQALDSSQSAASLKHALLVEDDANERALLAGYLRLCGFRVSEANDGVEALEFLKSHSVDLVVLDMRMPRMNGLETLSAINELPQVQHARVIVVSGEDRTELETGDCQLVDQWFSKPLNPAHLVGHLQSLAT